MKRVVAAAKPPPRLKISEWADQYRKLSSEASAEPGQWSTARAEYQRGIMDCISETVGKPVVIMTSAQIGKTELLNNVVGYHMDIDPCPIMVMQPTLDMAETWSKDRLAPMLRDNPVLFGKVADPRSRDSGNTLLHKRFPGGHIAVVGANSPSGLASRPIRALLADEVDRYPPSAGTEGDPLSLAIKRTTTFWNRRLVMVSTPTIKGLSRIEMEWDHSDQRYFYVPCPHCDEMQRLEWRHVKWPDGDPERAAYHCGECGCEWSEADRMEAVRRGEWRATANGRYPGFHISELYSPWSSIPRVAVAFVEAQRSPETRKSWVNTVLGEVYESDSEKIDHQLLADPSRLEDWGDTAPIGVLLVTCGVDVQADRLEVERVGWGIDEESWSLDHHVIHGDPSDPQTWARLDAYLQEPTIRVDGRQLPVRTTCIDSGGHHTQAVYKFCRLRRNRRVFAVKGRDDAATVWPSSLRARKSKQTQVTIVGVSAAKDAVYARLKVPQPGPGYCHFPKDRSPVWFEQLTSEVVETRYHRGFPRRVWILPDGRRNEALDCRVYAYAALQSLGVRWGSESMAAAPIQRPKAMPPPAVAAQALERMTVRDAPARSGRGSGFLSGRRGGGWLR